MKIERVALLDSSAGEFLADGGGLTLRLHDIKIFMANEGHDGDLQRWLQMFPELVAIPCEGDWCERYGVKNS